MPAFPNRPSFAAGELDPAFHGRVDFAKYHSGCKTLSNFIVHPQGGVSRRQGTAYIGEAMGDGRLIPFQFSTEQTYMLVFTDAEMQVLKDGGFIANCVDLVDADRWLWEESTGKAGYYYMTEPEGGAPPGITTTPYTVYDAAGNNINKDWGDYDTLGFFTLYIEAATDPGDEVFGYYYGYWADAPHNNNLTISSPFALADLAQLRCTQSADTMFFAHPSYPPYKLERYSHYTWRFTPVDFTPSMLAPDGLTATYSETPGATTRTMIYAVSAIDGDGNESLMSEQISATVDSPWASGAMVDLAWNEAPGAVQYSVWKNSRGAWGLIGTTSVEGSTGLAKGTEISGGDYAAHAKEKAFDGDADTDWRSTQTDSSVSGAAYIGLDMGAGGDIELKTFRILQRDDFGISSVKLQYSANGVDWSDLETFTLTEDLGTWESCQVSVDLVSARYWRLLANANNSNGKRWSVWELELYYRNYGKAFVDDNVNPDTTVGPIELSDPFNGEDAYPGSVALFEQRLWYASSNDRPSTVWASRTGIFHSFAVSTPLRADDGIEATLASRLADQIRHMIPLREMMVLTAGSEWRLGPGGNTDAVTPTSIMLTPQSYVGCAHLAPLVIGNTVLYVGRNGRQVRDMYFDMVADGYMGNNLSILAAHLFSGAASNALLDWCYARYPDSLVWCAKADGTLVALSYLREHDVWAWHRHSLAAGGETAEARAVAALPDDGDGADPVYMLVKRVLPDDSTVYYVEAMLAEYSDDVFLDCAILYTMPAAGTSATGLDWMEGFAVTVAHSNGTVDTGKTVTSGTVTWTEEEKSWVVIGLPYTSTLETLNIEFDAGGTAQGRRKKVHSATVRVLNSQYLEVGPETGNTTPHQEAATEEWGNGGGFTGDISIIIPPGWNSHGRLVITSAKPWPLTVLEIVPKVSLGE